MFIKNRNKQRGLSLIELMVGITVGMLVVAGTIAIYVVSLQGSTGALNNNKLNQELRGVMHTIVTDLQRAGYWGGAFKNGAFSTTPNPHLAAGTTISINSDGTCILYSYDLNNSAPVDVAAVANQKLFFGIKLNGTSKAVQLLTNGADADCEKGTWQTATDPKSIEITKLTFSTVETDGSLPYVSSQCRNVTKDIAWDLKASSPYVQACSASAADIRTVFNDEGTTAAYSAPTAKDTLYETRMIKVTLSGRLLSDAANGMTMAEQVKIMNDRILVVP